MAWGDTLPGRGRSGRAAAGVLEPLDDEDDCLCLNCADTAKFVWRLSFGLCRQSAVQDGLAQEVYDVAPDLKVPLGDDPARAHKLEL